MRDRARECHEAKLATLEKERDAVDTRIAAEQEHWEREEKDLTGRSLAPRTDLLSPSLPCPGTLGLTQN
jgi:hypothetical protein